jgi:hypothetical protein
MSKKYLNSTEFQDVTCLDGKKTAASARRAAADPLIASFRLTYMPKYAINNY